MPFAFERDSDKRTKPSKPEKGEQPQFSFQRSQGDILDEAVKSDPEQNAEKLKEFNTTAPPEPSEEARARQRSEEIRGNTDDAPSTSRFLQNPDNARVAHDATEELSIFEGLLRTMMTPYNIVQGMGESAADLAGGLFRVVGTPAETVRNFVAEEIADPGQLRFSPDGGVSWEPTNLDEPPLADLAEAAEGMGFGYEPGTTWEDVKERPITEFLPFAIETGLVSLPHAAAAVTNLPLYASARSGQLGQQRAEADEREDATVEDFIMAAPGAVASSLLDRMGAYGFLGMGEEAVSLGLRPIGKATGKAAGKESLTEGAQEAIESTTVTAGTETGFDAEVTAEAALQGAVAGLGFGGAARAVTGTTEGIANARRARVEKQVHDQMSEEVRNSTLQQRIPSKASEHVEQVLNDVGMPDIHVDAAQINAWLQQEPDPDAVVSQLGIRDELVLQEELGGDVTIPARQYAEVLLPSDRFQDLSPFIKTNPEGMSQAEADEYVAEGLPEELDNIQTLAEQPEEEIGEVEVAQQEMGLRGFFQTAEEAGMTSTQFNRYQETVQRASEQSVKNKEDRRLARLQRQNSDEIRNARSTIETEVRQGLENQPVYEAFNGIGRERLDRAAVERILEEERSRRAEGSRVPDPVFHGTFSDFEQFETSFLGVETEAASAREAFFFTSDVGVARSYAVDDRYKEILPSWLPESVSRGYAYLNEKLLRVFGQTLKNKGRVVQAKLNLQNPVEIDFGGEQIDEQTITDLLRSAKEEGHDGAIFRSIRDPGFDETGDVPSDVFAVFSPQQIQVENSNPVDDLPTQPRNRKIVTNKGTEGIDPEMYAHIHGYSSAEELLMAMVDAPNFETAVQRETETRLHQERPDLFSNRAAIIEERKALMNDSVAAMVTEEVNAMRKASGQGALSVRAMKNAAKETMRAMQIKNIRPNKFLTQASKLGKQAGRELRRGNREAAKNLKFQQLLNIRMAQEAITVESRVEKQRRYLQKFTRDIPRNRQFDIKYLDSIREIINNTRLRGAITPKRATATQEVANDDAVPIDVPSELTETEQTPHYKNMTLQQWTEMHDKVREIHTKARDANKLARSQEENARALAIQEVTENINDNIGDLRESGLVEERKQWNRLKRQSRELALLLFNTDTLLRQIDGWRNFGPAYRNLKQPYDQAVSNGYLPGSRGYTVRQHDAMRDVKDIYDRIYTTEEKASFGQKIHIDGVRQPVTRNIVLSVLLNSGNAGNIEAMLSGNTFTASEIEAIQNHASKSDWDVAQAIWDYFESYWPEVVAAEERRKNVRPTKVEAQPVDTRFGTYRGGYYPIRYDKQKSIVQTTEDMEEQFEATIYGEFAASHTNDSHTEQRKNPNKYELVYDAGVINAHLDNLLYDLEMHDALRDIFKVLHDERTKKAFADTGNKHRYEQLDMWLRDAITGERRDANQLEGTLRWLRTGFTASKLGWSFSVAMLQPFGLLQSSVLVGKRNMLTGVQAVAKNPRQTLAFMNARSSMMRSRESTYQKDIMDAHNQLKGSFLNGWVPENAVDFLRESTFFMIKKMQRFTDVVTWTAAFKDGMNRYSGDENQATDYADRMTIRTQASGIFGERTPLERGSVSPTRRQSEAIRVFTPLISYFMAKTNVAIERSGRLNRELRDPNMRNPIALVNYAVDMALTYTVEALLVGALRGQWPDDDDEMSFIEYVTGESINTLMGGVPFLREVSSDIQGFEPGGVIGSVVSEASSSVTGLYDAFTEGELDSHTLRSLNNLAGIFLHYPATQIARGTQATSRFAEGETDLNDFIAEFFIGGRRDDD